MTARLTDIFLAILLAWVCWGLAALLLAPAAALALGALGGVAGAVLLRDTLVVRGLVALFDPIGIVLPLLVLRQAAGALGLAVPSFGTVELLVFLALYIPFLATALGVWPVDLYRFGYLPVPVAILALAACLYGLLGGNWLVPLIAVAGQAAWVAGWGSSNYFDHVLHVALIPVAIVVLVLRLSGAG